MWDHRAILVLAVLACAAAAADEGPLVTLEQGQLRGKLLKTFSEKTMYAFLGIPYGKPPVKELRFKPPEPAGSWQGVYDATKNRSRCAQLRYPEMRFVGEEDCLFINIYATKLPKNKDDKILAPVIFYIHGGLFVHSSGDLEIYNPNMILDGEPGELVFVTFNYRLGPLGFLSTEDAECPGNFGLKDQVLAMKWVQKNIAAFGGDPGKVTLMGDNAGAASAHLHMMSPLSKGLFKQAISQSGNALTHWVWNRDPLGRTQQLAELLECGDNTTSSHDIIKCMRTKPAELVVKKSNIVIKWRTDWIVSFTPSVEDFDLPEGTAFITQHPRELMENKLFNPVPWLVGVTSHDGLPHSLNLLLFGGIAADLNNDFEKYAPYYFELEGPMENAIEAAKLIKEYYFKDAGIGMGSQAQLADMHTDYYYFISLVKSVALHVMAEAPPAYVYHFSYQNRLSRLALGVPQGDDTQYMLPRDDGGRLAPKANSEEMKVAQRLISLVKNFIKIGVPIPAGDNSFGVPWPPVTMEMMSFIDFNKKLSLNETFYADRVAFWNDIEDLLITGDSVLRDGPEDPTAKDEL